MGDETRKSKILDLNLVVHKTNNSLRREKTHGAQREEKRGRRQRQRHRDSPPAAAEAIAPPDETIPHPFEPIAPCLYEYTNKSVAKIVP